MADTIQRAAARVIDAWDSTVLPVANDGRLQEAMEDLRAAMAAMADTPTLREAAQQALEALAPLANATTPAEREALTDADAQAADAASCDLRAALAEQAEPHAWTRVVDEALTSYNLDVANESDDYATAKGKMENLLAHAGNVGAYHAAEQAEPVERLVTRKGDKLGAITAGMEDSPGITLLRRLVDSICIINNGERDLACWDHGAMFDLRDLLCADPPAPARQEWQPIATAPRETEVLIGAWIDGEFKWGRSVRFYDSGNEREGEPACGWVWSIDDCSDSVAENPTCWMPAPSAPITDGAAEGGAA